MMYVSLYMHAHIIIACEQALGGASSTVYSSVSTVYSSVALLLSIILAGMAAVFY